MKLNHPLLLLGIHNTTVVITSVGVINTSYYIKRSKSFYIVHTELF